MTCYRELKTALELVEKTKPVKVSSGCPFKINEASHAQNITFLMDSQDAVYKQMIRMHHHKKLCMIFTLFGDIFLCPSIS